MRDQMQGHGVQDAPPPVPTVVPTVALPADAVARLLNMLEALVPAQGGSCNNSVDPQIFLDGALKALRALGCSSERAMELAAYKLEDMANTWYEIVLLGRPTGATPLTWDEFTKLFMNYFLQDNLMQKYARDFERLSTLLERLQPRDMKSVQLVIYVRRPRQEGLSVAVLVKIEEQEIRDNNRVPRQGHTCFYSPHTGRITDRFGHHLRDCPHPPRNFNQASIQSVAPTQTTHNTSGAIGIGNRGRGAGERATVNQRQGNACGGQARVFAFTRQDAQTLNVVVRGILFICSFDALPLIDSGSTHSYVSLYFSLRFSRYLELLNDPFLVATPVRESLLAEYMYRACQIRVNGRDTIADLIVLDIIDFDMLLGMDWLYSCYAIVDCHAKIVKFEIPNEPSFVLKGGQVPATCKVVSFLKAQRLLKKGCLGLLAIVNDTRKETISIENVPLVREFSDVFPDDLPGLPLVREIDFGVDLPPDTQPILIPPYRMAPAELKDSNCIIC
ncbi:uncharacterized protein [Nicotiana tomentosiformis]|uniref:uncharacterized protein n=1 Tax=Nicotiana tomentosiformis TaxID=4098 RepID=UPI00388CE301